MIKYIQTLFLIVAVFCNYTFAQQTENLTSVSTTKGYYQTVDLNAETPCGCDSKTQRTHDLAKGLIPYDVLNYKLHAYKFTFGNSMNAVAKLFKAFENDATIYKVSMKEWTSFMLLTSDKFDAASFEKAAKTAFATFEPMEIEDFLKAKNTSSYNEFMKAKEEAHTQQIQK